MCVSTSRWLVVVVIMLAHVHTAPTRGLERDQEFSNFAMDPMELTSIAQVDMCACM